MSAEDRGMTARRGRFASVMARQLAGVALLALALGGCSGSPPAHDAASGEKTTPTPSATAAPVDPTTPPAREPEPTPVAPPAPVPAPAPIPTPGSAPAQEPGPDPDGSLPAAWRGIDVERLPTSRRVVALTFDGGASDTAVQPILATLDLYDAPATFFVTGAFARSYPDAVRAIAAAGHAVGNHSDTHPDFTTTTSAAIRAELATAEAHISSLTGASTRPLFRFPFGARTPADIRVVNDAGYIPIRWTVDTLGWKGTSGGIDAHAVHRRVIDSLQPGAIVLMHVGRNPDDGTTLDADALPGLIEEVRRQGYEFVQLRQMIS